MVCISMVSSYTPSSNVNTTCSRRRLLRFPSILAPLLISSAEVARAGELCLEPLASSAATAANSGCSGTASTNNGSVTTPDNKKSSVPEHASLSSPPPTAPVTGKTDLQRAMMEAGGGKGADPRAHGR